MALLTLVCDCATCVNDQGDCAATVSPNAMDNVTVVARSGVLEADFVSGGFVGQSINNASSPLGGDPRHGLRLHPSSISTLQGVREWINREPGFDFVVYLKFESHPARNTWVYASKAAVAQLNPGWLSVFSLSLLRPRVRFAQLRLAPSMCPTAAADVVQYGGRISGLLREELDLQPGQALLHQPSTSLMCRYELEGATVSGFLDYIRT